MGGTQSAMQRIIWCDTEGGVKQVPLWDATFIEDDGTSVRATRYCSVNLAHKRGRGQLQKWLPKAVYEDNKKPGTTCIVEYEHDTDTKQWSIKTHTVAESNIQTLVTSFLSKQSSSIIAAWNMKAHDKHVLRRCVGAAVLNTLTLWDPLPWFRSRYSLPKNTLNSNRPGTPRAVFDVPVYGDAHSSFVDAAHMRDVVCRAAYCYAEAEGDTEAWTSASKDALDTSVRDAINEHLNKPEIISVWTKIPSTVKSEV